MSKCKSTPTSLSKASKFRGRWDEAITDAYELIARAKARIKELKTTITLLEELRDSDAPWPGTSESSERHMGQDGDLGQSLGYGLCLISRVLERLPGQANFRFGLFGQTGDFLGKKAWGRDWIKLAKNAEAKTGLTSMSRPPFGQRWSQRGW